MVSPKKVHVQTTWSETLYTAENCTSSYQTRVTGVSKGHVRQLNGILL
jgi:hypothetical protein